MIKLVPSILQYNTEKLSSELPEEQNSFFSLDNFAVYNEYGEIKIEFEVVFRFFSYS